MPNLNKDPDWMIRLRGLLPNWDSEGAPIPSEESIAKAKDIIDWVIQNNLNINSIDPDVIGGVAIYLNGINDRLAWVSILNSGSQCIVFRCIPRGRVTGCILNDAALEKLKFFLLDEEYNVCNKQ
jgi:hypothetical protein